MIATALVSVALGAACGWMAHRSKEATRWRVLDELYSRKWKLADQQREEALRTAAQARQEASQWAARLAEQAAEFEALREAAQQADIDRRRALALLERREHDFALCRESALEGTRARALGDFLLADARGRADSAAQAVDQAYDELMERDSRLYASERRLAEAQEHCGRSSAELARVQFALDQAQGARAGLLADLEQSRADGERLAQTLEGIQREADRVPALELQRAELESRLGQEVLRVQGLVDRLGEAEPRARRAQELAQKLERELARVGARGDDLEARLAEARSAADELASLRADLARSLSDGQALAAQLAREREQVGKLQAAQVARAEDLRTEKRESARLAKELSLALAGAENAQRSGERLAERAAALESALEARDQRIKTLVPQPRPKDARPGGRPAAKTGLERRGGQRPAQRPAQRSAADDLRRIAGIGPVLAKKLQRLGVESFEQLAALTRTEIEALAKQLGIGAERIRREGWIASARVALRSRDGG